MAEPGKNLPPTKRKLDKARKRGDVARYRDVLCYVSLAAGFGALLLLLPERAGAVLRFTSRLMGSVGAVDGAAAAVPDAMPWIRAAGGVFLGAAASVIVPVFVLTLAVGLMTTGFVFTLRPVSPKLGRLNPLEGARRIFSGEKWFGLLKDFLKIGLLAAAGFFTVKASLELLPAFTRAASPEAAREILFELARTIFLYTSLALVPILLMDVFYTRHSFRRKMMMTREELKKELRETEGDPSIKGRRQQLHREIARHRMLQDVRRATVVVVNPDHLAVALRWVEEEMEAPTVVASGRDHMAARIIGEARRCGVPVVRDFTLARSLAELQVGEEIPENLYEAVAGIIRLLSG